MRNVLFARGDSFIRGARVKSPTGNIDIAPTILRLLGLPTPAMDGRVLREALVGGKPVGWQTRAYTARRELADGVYRQRIQVSSVGNARYVDEGNGGLE